MLSTKNQYLHNFHALHGSAVAWCDRAYLFLASTASGKTTLASYLTSHGFGYITDDCILLNRSSFTVQPNIVPIQLRDGGLDVLKRYNSEPNHVELINDRYVYIPSNCVTTSLQLGGIYFIERTDFKNAIVPMTTNERITQLMKSPSMEYPLTSEYIRFISKVAKYDCHYLFYSDMNYVIEVIMNE